MDVGRAWEPAVSTPDPDTIASVGVGARVSAFQSAQFNVYWGQQLNHVPDPNTTLRDQGVHLELVVQVL